ncbi:hypothetical protein Metlim_2926 [Methanoplanus limicola DSM 2279]|uniref:Uncharacterized protein n=1 Tax=Methanoplanus limicola DSM 2279 TaxID=937775 RepID=H1YY24_9EURY|nr:hypothetical protein Metlim_2926 [Methanoplanus limicola DSM 2279]
MTVIPKLMQNNYLQVSSESAIAYLDTAGFVAGMAVPGMN